MKNNSSAHTEQEFRAAHKAIKKFSPLGVSDLEIDAFRDGFGEGWRERAELAAPAQEIGMCWCKKTSTNAIPHVLSMGCPGFLAANTTTVDLRDSEEKSEAGRVMLSGVQDHADNALIVGGEYASLFGLKQVNAYCWKLYFCNAFIGAHITVEHAAKIVKQIADQLRKHHAPHRKWKTIRHKSEAEKKLAEFGGLAAPQTNAQDAPKCDCGSDDGHYSDCAFYEWLMTLAALERFLPPGYAIGDDATAALAVELADVTFKLGDANRKIAQLKAASVSPQEFPNATPGPWQYEEGGFIGAVAGPRVCQMWNKFEENFANCEENARLIVAAVNALKLHNAPKEQWIRRGASSPQAQTQPRNCCGFHSDGGDIFIRCGNSVAGIKLRHGASPSSPAATSQEILTKWAEDCFGSDQVNSPAIRGLRLAEESIEFSQSVDVPAEKLHALIDYVYSRPKGTPAQELGGVAVTALVAASSIGAQFDDCLQAETQRVLAKPREHFAARNQQKVDLGFTAAASSSPEPEKEK